MDGVSDRVRRVGTLAWAGIGVLVLGWALLRLLGAFRPVIPPVLTAILIFVILHPAVTWLERRGVRRHLGTTLCFLGLVGVVVGFGYLFVPLVVDQTRAFLGQLPSLLTAYQPELGGEAGQTLEEALARLAAWLQETDRLLGAGQQAFAFAGSVLVSVASVLLGAVIAFYAVADFPRIQAAIRGILPPRARPVMERLFEQTLAATTEFMQVRLFLALVVGALGAVGFYLIDLPFWLLLGVILGVTNVIPILGTYLGSIPALMVAWLTLGPTGTLWTLGVLVVSSAVDGYVLTPLLMRQHLHLHPIAVILAVVIGGAWYGVWGVLFAIPLLAAIRSFLGEYLRLRGYLRHEREDGDERGVPMPLEEAMGG